MLDGRLEWTAGNPRVIRLTDNGERRMRLALVEHDTRQHTPRRRLYGFELGITIADVDAFVEELIAVRDWVEHGDPDPDA